MEEGLDGKIAKVCSVVQMERGYSVVDVDACSVGGGYTGVKLLGNVSSVCTSAIERAESALRSSGLEMAASRAIVSFSPGDVRIEGNQFDLAIAMLLAQIQSSAARDFRAGQRWVLHAELSLDGRLRSCRGAIPAVIAAMKAGCSGIVCAKDQEREISKVISLVKQNQFCCLAFNSLSEVLNWYFSGEQESNIATGIDLTKPSSHEFDFDDMNLTESLLEAAVVIATGFHSALILGPPGSGKTMFAQRIPSILPRLEGASHMQALYAQSLADDSMSEAILQGFAPYRAPHHSATYSAILGNGQRPGELTLATGGVLFLDEFPEFRRDVLEALREPLESKKVNLSRASFRSEEQLRFLFLAAANPCPCGWIGSKKRVCKCAGGRVYAYQQRMSGPILDRIDLNLFLESSFESTVNRLGQTKALRSRVLAATAFSRERNVQFGCVSNAEVGTRYLSDLLRWTDEYLLQTQQVLSSKLETVRSVNKTLRVARTFADLDCVEVVTSEHVSKAQILTKSFQAYAGI